MLEYTVKVREPYMGNQVPLTIRIYMDEERITRLTVINEEGIYHNAQLVAEVKNGERKEFNY
jgi:hypothetical protein